MPNYIIDIDNPDGPRTIVREGSNPEAVHKTAQFDELAMDENIAKIRDQRTDRVVYSLGSGFTS